MPSKPAENLPQDIGISPILLHEFNEVNSVSIEYFRIGVESYNHQHTAVHSEETLRAHIKIITLFFVRLKKLESDVRSIYLSKDTLETGIKKEAEVLKKDCKNVQGMLIELYFLLRQPAPENINKLFYNQE